MIPSKRVKSLHSCLASAKPLEGNATVEHSAGKDGLSDVIWYYLREDSNPQSARICLSTPPQRYGSDVRVPADRWRAPRGAAGIERLARRAEI